MDPEEWERIYPRDVQAEIARTVRVLAPVLSPKEALGRPDVLGQMDLLLSGWGGPVLNQQFLKMAPDLKALFYGAGAVRHLLTDESLERQIVVTTANTINAIPVAEFSLAHILLGLKCAWGQAVETKRRRTFTRLPLPVPGGYQSTVGLISLSTIGRLVLQLLKPFDVEVLAYDPTIDKDEALPLGVVMESLQMVFACSHVVSLHAPLVPETKGMITGSLLASMKAGATFINTSRGAVVNESEMIEVLRARPDLTAILDVTEPEPPSPTSELFDLPNVVLTPHIAGSLDGECRRMGRWIADEIQRYVAGKPLLGDISSIQRRIS